MVDPRPASQLVTAALDGDERAWNSIVERYASLVTAVARQHRLDHHELADVSQTVWLRLVENLRSLREPRALAGWIMATCRHECIRTVRARARELPLELDTDIDDVPVDSELLEAERRDVLREAFALLPDQCQELLALLVEDPPAPYEEISRRLYMPRGSIGPTRARCLDKLRRSPALQALIGNEQGHVQESGRR